MKKSLIFILISVIFLMSSCYGTQPTSTSASQGTLPNTIVIDNCITEGNKATHLPGNENTCCRGLKEIALTANFSWKCSTKDITTGIQTAPCKEQCKYIMLVGNGGYCTKCGDGLCKYPENYCNCPEDCKL